MNWRFLVAILSLSNSIAATPTAASVVRVETVEVGNKLNLAEIEVTSGMSTGLPNRTFSFEQLIPSVVSDFISVPEANAANTITVLGTADAVAPSGNDRLLLLGDPHLNTGVFNPSANSPGIQLTFSEPLVNGPGEELVIFELTIGAGQSPDPLKVRQVGGVGDERIVPSSHYQMQRAIPATLAPNTFLASVENGGTTDLAELASTELVNFGAVANPRWHVMPIDLDWLGVTAWQSVSSIEIVSGDATRAADLLMVMGLRPVASPGDYNFDLTVDGADFLVWQRQFGLTEIVTADGNGDNAVDSTDLGIWRDNFGHGVMSGSVAANVPEPSARFIGALGGALAATFTRLRVRPKLYPANDGCSSVVPVLFA